MIGRQVEHEEFFRHLESEQSDFVVVFGRRRVGKTYLVREYFNNTFTFYHTEMAESEFSGH
jgi:AAA+ ATPase superfamily predicted ATPase